ncbi:MAG TPA: hypothetical protein VGP68_10495 [Gemmataceae bacterium]|nr:hypothetical protein [Gemmataceae bacterium]
MTDDQEFQEMRDRMVRRIIQRCMTNGMTLQQASEMAERAMNAHPVTPLPTLEELDAMPAPTPKQVAEIDRWLEDGEDAHSE